MTSANPKPSRQTEDWHADTYISLAGKLDKHFRGRIGIEITSATLRDWRNGDRGVPVEAEDFPERNGNRMFDVSACAKWIEKWMLPVFPLTPSGDAASPQAVATLRMQDELSEIAQKQKRRDIENGLYYSKSEVAMAIDAVGAVMKSSIIQNCERLFETKIAETVRAMNLPDEQTATILDQVRKTGRDGTDQILKAIDQAMMDKFI